MNSALKLNLIIVIISCIFIFSIGKPQKGYLFSGPATKMGGGAKGLATKKKELFLKLEKKSFPKKCGH